MKDPFKSYGKVIRIFGQEKKARLLELIAHKQDKELEEKPLEELLQLVDKL